MAQPKFVTTDTETGGLDPRLHPLLSVSVLICTDEYEEYDRGWEQKVLPPPRTLLEVPVEEEQYADAERWKKCSNRKIYGYIDVFSKQIVSHEEFKALNNVELTQREQHLQNGTQETFTERLKGVAEGKRLPLVVTAVAAEINGYIGFEQGAKYWRIEAVDNWHSDAAPLDIVDIMYVKYLSQAFSSRPIAVAHNAEFDSKFIQYYLPNAFAHLHSFKCTCKMFREYYKMRGIKGSAKLDKLIELCGYKSNNLRHGSLEDSKACLAGLKWLVGEKLALEAEGREE